MELNIHTHQLRCPQIPHNRSRTTPMFPQKQSSFSPSRTSYNPRRLVVLRADHTSGGSTRKSMEDFNFDFELELKKMKQVSIDGRGSDQSSEEEEKECRERKLIEELEGLEEEALITGDDVNGREPIDYNRRARMFDACSKVFQGLKHT